MGVLGLHGSDGAAMIRWHEGKTRTVRLSSLKLPGDWKQRLDAAHVAERAGSTAKVGVINLPVVEWKTKTLVAGADRVAALVVGGLKPNDTVEARAFDGDEDGIREVRAHENAHRRHDDRDAWLRSLVDGDAEQPVQELTGHEAVAKAWAERDDRGFPLPVSHVADANGYPLCGAVLNRGDSTVGHLSSSPINCLFCVTRLENAAPEMLGAEDGKRNKLLRSESAKSPQTAKSEARKKVAETVGTTPAAVKQAEYRDRKAKGEVQPRKVHDDSGPAMSEAAQGLVADIAAIALALQHQQAAIGRLMERNPSLQVRFGVGSILEQIKGAASSLRLMTPAAVCCYCIDNAAEDCHACKNDRFLTKAQLRDAPEEMRKRVA